MPTYSTLTVERNVAVPMRDGVNLYADIYPAGRDRDRSHPAAADSLRQKHDQHVPAHLAGCGARLRRCLQRCAGTIRFRRSDFMAFVNERNDGYDVLEWLTNQPWCDGNVGMFSQSYVGLTQWQAALSGHPALKAIVPVVTADDYHDGWVYQGGAFELSFNLSWTWSNLAVNTIVRRKRRTRRPPRNTSD